MNIELALPLTRVLIVDDHGIVREGLVALVDVAGGLPEARVDAGDLRLRRSRPVSVPQLPWVLGFYGWALFTAAIRKPEMAVPLASLIMGNISPCMAARILWHMNHAVS